MPIAFACPHCNRGYNVADANAGKRFACKQCGKPVMVPTVADNDDPVPLEIVDEPPAPVPAPMYAPGAPVMPRPRHGPRSTTTRITRPTGPVPYPHGAPPGHYPPPYAVNKPLSMMSLIGLIFAFLGPLSLVGVVLSTLGLKETKPHGPRSGRGLAIAGMVLNILAIVGLLIAAVLFAVVASALNQAGAESRAAIQSDFSLIANRAQTYYFGNSESLAAGGPSPAPSAGGEPAYTLNVSALADAAELKYPQQLGSRNPDSVYHIQVTGARSLRVTCRFMGQPVAVLDISDVSMQQSTVNWSP